MSHNLFELFATKYGPHLDQPFLTVPGGPQATYGEIDRLAGLMATALAAQGANPGDRIVVQVDKSIHAVALYLACLRGGFIYIPLNTAYTAEEVGYYLGDAEPVLMVFPSAKQASLGPVTQLTGTKTLTLDADGGGTLAEVASTVTTVDPVVARDTDDIACILYTSGTTGRSKGAMLTHGGIATNGKALHVIWRFRPGDVLLHALPIFHVHGLFVALHCAILNASEVLFLPRFDAEAVRASLPRATVMMGVPTFYTRLMEDPEFGPTDCGTIRLFTSGSAPMTEAVFNQFTARTGHTICERYGMTECGIITSNPPEDQRIAGTVGYALPQMELRIADEDDQPVPNGDVGMIQVRGPHIFGGYWRQPEKTAEAMTPTGFFRTGDLGFCESDNRLTLVGRTSDMAITGGYNVYPKEVEMAIDEVPGVIESAVVGLPHQDFGEAITAFVVADDTVTEDGIAEAIESSLASFKRPKAYIFLESLPRNTMGKVQKAQLRSAYATIYSDN